VRSLDLVSGLRVDAGGEIFQGKRTTDLSSERSVRRRRNTMEYGMRKVTSNVATELEFLEDTDLIYLQTNGFQGAVL
jgi:hypothetical protein